MCGGRSRKHRAGFCSGALVFGDAQHLPAASEVHPMRVPRAPASFATAHRELLSMCCGESRRGAFALVRRHPSRHSFGRWDYVSIGGRCCFFVGVLRSCTLWRCRQRSDAVENQTHFRGAIFERISVAMSSRVQSLCGRAVLRRPARSFRRSWRCSSTSTSARRTSCTCLRRRTRTSESARAMVGEALRGDE